MITINNLTKKYNIGKPNEVTVLDSISLTVEDGDFLAIMGRSGVGKSTLLHIIALLDKQTEGEYMLNGTNTFKMSDSQSSVCRNKNIGILLQDFRLIESDTVLENVMTPLYFSKIPFLSMKKYARAALAKVGISSLEKQIARTLSGGEKQRVGLARAIVNSPSILLADEPTGALDNTNRDALIDLISEINNDGTTVIIVTHDNYIAERCKRKIILNDGKVE